MKAQLIIPIKIKNKKDFLKFIIPTESLSEGDIELEFTFNSMGGDNDKPK